MHPDPQNALFSAPTNQSAGVRLVILALALVSNGLYLGTWPSVTVGMCGLLAFAVEGLGIGRSGRAGSWAAPVKRTLRLKLLAAGTSYAIATGVLAAVLSGDRRFGLQLGLRLGNGLIWGLWISATLRWPAVQRTLRKVRGLAALSELLDLWVLHGLLLWLKLGRMRAAVLLRGGQINLTTCGLVLAQGVEQLLASAANLDTARVLRAPLGARNADSAPTDPVVSLAEVSVSYADDEEVRTGLCAASLALLPGEWIAVIGPSGSGKTTLLRLLCGLLPVHSGSFTRFGQPVAGSGLATRADRRIALLCQDPAEQLFGATPLDDVTWGLRQRGVSEQSAEVAALHMLRALGLEADAERPICNLSGGERKRVALASALVLRPQLLLCDEPTGGLDPVAAHRLIRLVEQEAGQHDTAVVWVTHELQSIPKRVSRVVILNHGHIIFVGPREQALEPARLHAAGLWIEQ